LRKKEKEQDALPEMIEKMPAFRYNI